MLLVLLPLSAFAEEYVKWTATIPSDAAPNTKTTVELNAEIAKGWHLYSIEQVEDGPVATTIEAVAPVKLDGAIDPSPAVKKLDPNFDKEIGTYEESAAFKVPVVLGPDVKKGGLQVRFQVCNNTRCEFPKTVEVGLTGEAAKAVQVKGDTTDPKSQGLLQFAGFAFTAGLLALLTPCVFPMVPITVSYFAKRREKDPKGGTTGAAAYCFGIIGAFTGFGLIVTLLFGASGIQRFATNPIVNLLLAALFVFLALNLFGMFQLTLPSKFTNAFNGHGKQGLLGPIFMGLTFTLTSFTCTVPFVGTILVSAAQGDILYPFVGMLAFSTAFSLPFFLLALFPGFLAKLPKSGSWLEMVKAFMGFLELAAAIKFLSNADLVWGTGLISRTTFLIIWSVIFAAAALFLLRIVKLPKVEVPQKMGRGRAIATLLTALTTVWLISGATGRSLGEVEAFLPPGTSDGWNEIAYDRALAIARRDKKPILIDFTGVTCTNCRWMEKNMFTRDDVAAEFPNYVRVKLFTDRNSKADRDNQELMKKLTGSVSLPIYVVVSPDDKVLRTFAGSTREPEKFIEFLKPKA